MKIYLNKCNCCNVAHLAILKLYKTLYYVVFLEFFQIFLELIYRKPIKSWIVLVVYTIYTDAYLELSRTQLKQKIVKFCKKAQSLIFDWVLNTPLIRNLLIHTKALNTNFCGMQSYTQRYIHVTLLPVFRKTVCLYEIQICIRGVTGQKLGSEDCNRCFIVCYYICIQRGQQLYSPSFQRSGISLLTVGFRHNQANTAQTNPSSYHVQRPVEDCVSMFKFLSQRSSHSGLLMTGITKTFVQKRSQEPRNV